MLSVFGAEVISGSFPYPFFSAWGWLVLMPLYGLHMVVLASVVLKRGAPRLSTLYMAGMLFGLYEAYITKVLWSSPWGMAEIAGIGIFELTLLVFLWHPLMAFILPLSVAERTLAQSRTVSIPRWVWVVAGCTVLFVWLLTLKDMSFAVRFSSLLAGAGVVAVPVAVWRLLKAHRGLSLDDLVPSRGVLIVLAVALAALYYALGSIIKPDDVPPLSDQAGIWALYAAILYLLLRHRKPALFRR